MSAKVYLLCEGQSEQLFVQQVLAPHFEHLLSLVPILVRTSRAGAQTVERGGYVTWARLRQQLLNLLADRSAVQVSMLIDLYRLPKDAPSPAGPVGVGPIARASAIEAALAKDINHPGFLPYVQVHELEALVLVEPQRLVQHGADPVAMQALTREIDRFASPEHVDEGPLTSPSRRIAKAFPRYSKTLHAPQVLRDIGVQALRDHCSHFNEWVTCLDAIAALAAFGPSHRS